MKKIFAFGAICFCTLIVTNCKKENKEENSCEAGIGGQVELVLFPQHHGRSILGQPDYLDSAFIKFNTQEFPGENPSLYDLVVAGRPPSDSVQVFNMKCGNYFIFMTGFDTLINQRVKGGVPVVVTDTAGRAPELIPVTEGD